MSLSRNASHALRLRVTATGHRRSGFGTLNSPLPQHIIRIPVAKMGGTKTIGPRPRFYAVIQMDPETMIRDWKLDDEQALKEVEEMRPQKYLIYLDTVSFVHVHPTFRSCILELSPFFA